MVRLHFRDTKDFEGLFKNKKRNVTDGIVSGIEEAMKHNKKSAPLFQLTFDTVDRIPCSLFRYKRDAFLSILSISILISILPS